MTTLGNYFEGGMEASLVIATLSQWFFSFAIAWFFCRNNPYINNFLIYSIIPLGVVIAIEFSVFYLFYDYIHLLPFIVDIYILWKLRETLKQKLMLCFTGFFTVWLFLDYFLGLAYMQLPLVFFLLAIPIWSAVMVGASFLFRVKAETGKKGLIRKVFKGFLVGFWIFGMFLGSVLIYWYFRPNGADVNRQIVVGSWVAATGKHNSNSDLIYWNETFYLIHDNRPFHLGSSEAKLIVWKSQDAQNWIKIIEFQVPGEDIRDPKFALIKNRLFVYALKNKGIMADPYQTLYTYSDDGMNWQPLQEVALGGWLFWRPKTRDNLTWYNSAYWHEHGKAILLNSTDGINWNIVASIYEGEANDETEIEFLPDGRLICTSRLEGNAGADSVFGSSNASTLIAISSYPYTNWSSYVKSRITRLDGPCLFSYDNKTFAVGRYQPGPRTPFTELGSVFSKKRTAIFLVEENGLTYLTDLPSAGDTSYAGVVQNGTDLYVSYYTSDITKDFPWILGMVADSDIRIAQVNLTALVALVES